MRSFLKYTYIRFNLIVAGINWYSNPWRTIPIYNIKLAEAQPWRTGHARLEKKNSIESKTNRLATNPRASTWIRYLQLGSATSACEPTDPCESTTQQTEKTWIPFPCESTTKQRWIGRLQTEGSRGYTRRSTRLLWVWRVTTRTPSPPADMLVVASLNPAMC